MAPTTVAGSSERSNHASLATASPSWSTSSRRRCGESLGQRGGRRGDHAGEVVWEPPRPALLAAARRGRLRDQRWQDVGRSLPSQVFEDLEGLVGEVDGVAAVEEHVVGDRSEHHAGDRGGVLCGDRRCQRALGGVRRTGLDEPPVPELESIGGQLAAERKQREARRPTAGVAGHERQTVDQRQTVVGRIEVGQHVGHRREHGEPGAPARLPIARPEVHAGAHDVARRHGIVEQTEHGLGDDQRDALLQSLLQAMQQVARPVALGFDDDGHPTVFDLDRVGPHVVGPRIQRAARAQIEAGVVPVAGQQPALDRPTMQRETHVRTAVIERVGRSIAPQHADRLRPGLACQAPVPAQLVQRPDRHANAHRDLPGFLPSRARLTSRLRTTAGSAARSRRAVHTARHSERRPWCVPAGDDADRHHPAVMRRR